MCEMTFNILQHKPYQPQFNMHCVWQSWTEEHLSSLGYRKVKESARSSGLFYIQATMKLVIEPILFFKSSVKSCYPISGQICCLIRQFVTLRMQLKLIVIIHLSAFVTNFIDSFINRLGVYCGKGPTQIIRAQIPKQSSDILFCLTNRSKTASIHNDLHIESRKYIHIRS